MTYFLKFYNVLGSNNSQRFWRLFFLIALIGSMTIASINVGYDKVKGFYWKPADISINKNIGKSSAND